MATLVLTHQSAGAPNLVGVNGSLNAVLDWALPQAGWAIEYTGANARVYRPGSGNRNRLYVAHDSVLSGSAGLAVTRGCENASSVTALIDAFPTVAQYANSLANFCVGTNTSTAREYVIIVSPTYVLMAVNTLLSNTSGWDIFFFGDLVPAYSEDLYATAILIGNSSTATGTTARAMGGVIFSTMADSTRLFWARSIDGSIKSTRGSLNGSTGSSQAFCNVTGTPNMRAGYLNHIVREKLSATCIGSTVAGSPGPLGIMRRAWVPNLWNPLHFNIGTMTSDDTFTDTAYAAGSLFKITPASANVAAIIEMSDTWVAPIG